MSQDQTTDDEPPPDADVAERLRWLQRKAAQWPWDQEVKPSDEQV